MKSESLNITVDVGLGKKFFEKDQLKNTHKAYLFSNIQK